MAYPAKLQEVVELLQGSEDRSDRIDLLRSFAERLRPVPPDVCERPYPLDHRAPNCESEAYVWVLGSPESVHLWFAVENPQGITAKALAAILMECYEGLPAENLAQIPDDLVYDLFGRQLSMGKTLGLMGMIQSVRRWASALGRS